MPYYLRGRSSDFGPGKQSIRIVRLRLPSLSNQFREIGKLSRKQTAS